MEKVPVISAYAGCKYSSLCIASIISCKYRFWIPNSIARAFKSYELKAPCNPSMDICNNKRMPSLFAYLVLILLILSYNRNDDELESRFDEDYNEGAVISINLKGKLIGDDNGLCLGSALLACPSLTYLNISGNFKCALYDFNLYIDVLCCI